MLKPRWLNEDWQIALTEKYPKILAKEGVFFYFEVMDGWAMVINNLMEEIDALWQTFDTEYQEAFYIIQIKEKFGKLRVYTSLYNPDIEVLISKSEALSGSTCEVCGEPGKVVSCHGWLRAVCGNCENNY